jgi:predicted transcriptional regulator
MKKPSKKSLSPKKRGISKIKAVKKVSLKKFDYETFSLDQYNREIEEAEARIERGEFVLREDAINRIKEWREKGSDPG